MSATQKSVRLDLYVETGDGTTLDIEMQTTNGTEGWLPKRMRYYQAIIDLSVLEKGKEYVEFNGLCNDLFQQRFGASDSDPLFMCNSCRQIATVI